MSEQGSSAATAALERPLGRAERPLYVLLGVLLAAGGISVACGFLQLAPWREQPLVTLLIAIIVGLPAASAAGKWLLLPKMRRPRPVAPEPGLRVAAVATYVPGSEPLEMAECTLRAMLRMDYPHDCWLLDEGDDLAARALCERLGVHHFSRAHRPEYQAPGGTFQSRCKHGNYNAWLADGAYDRYDVIVSFDLDHVPERDFLTATLGYFRDPAVGYVQSPQAYYNQEASFIAAGAAEETYDYQSTIQMSSYALGYPIVVGCHNVHRVSALREVGGYADHAADDVLITMRYRQRRWLGVYVPRILARGLTPVDWDSYLIQQRRWARSLCDLKFLHRETLGPDTPASARWMSYLHGLAYLQPLVIFVLAGALLVTLLATATVPVVLATVPLWGWTLLGGAMVLCYLYRQRFFLDPPRERGLHLRARILRIAKAPMLLLGLLDALSTRQFGYDITRKSAAVRASKRLSRIFAGCALVLALAWCVGVLTHAVYPFALHFVAAAAVVICLGIAATDSLPIAPPFERRLLERNWAPWLA